MGVMMAKTMLPFDSWIPPSVTTPEAMVVMPTTMIATTTPRRWPVRWKAARMISWATIWPMLNASTTGRSAAMARTA